MKDDRYDLRPPKALCKTCRKTQTRYRCVECGEPLCAECLLDDRHEHISRTEEEYA